MKLSVKHICVGLSLIFLGLAFGDALKMRDMKQSSEGSSQVALVLDVSQSMNVEDIAGKSRLGATKEMIYSLLSQSQGQRFSLTIFAGESQKILPFTDDISLLATFIQSLDSNNITLQGTRIDLGITDALSTFGEGESGYLIVFSDGAEEEMNLPKELKKYVEDRDIQVSIVGVGSVEGGYIPTRDVFEPYKVYQGKRVVSRLNETALQKLAQQLGGVYSTHISDIHIPLGIEERVSQNMYGFQWSWMLFGATFFWLCFLLFGFFEIYRKK